LPPVAGSVHSLGVRRIASDEQEVQILWSMLNSSDSEGVEDEDNEDEPPPQEVEVEVEVSEAAPATAVLDDAPPQVRASPPLHAPVPAPAPAPARRKRSLVMEPSDDDSDSDDGGGVGTREEGSGGGADGGGGGDEGDRLSDRDGGGCPSEAAAAAVEPRVTEEQGYKLALSSRSKTGYRCVSANPSRSVSRPFMASFSRYGKSKSLGSFATAVSRPHSNPKPSPKPISLTLGLTLTLYP